MDLIYTDEKVTWVMEGPLIDAMTRRDVTRESQEKLSAVTFDQLPLDLAIKQVKGDGSRKVAIFEDPNCGYCKQLRKTMESVDNVTIYTFLYPILSPDSRSRYATSGAPGPGQDLGRLDAARPEAGRRRMRRARGQAAGAGPAPDGAWHADAVFADGSRISGALPLDQLKERLN